MSVIAAYVRLSETSLAGLRTNPEGGRKEPTLEAP
jgi:hypothetical protein